MDYKNNIQTRIDNLYSDCANSLLFCENLNRDYEVSDSGKQVPAMAQILFLLAQKRAGLVTHDSVIIELMLTIIDREFAAIAGRPGAGHCRAPD